MQHNLFLGIIAQHKPVIFLYHLKLAQENQETGTDVLHYQGHSTRSALTSKAKVVELKVAIRAISTNWGTAGTFEKFYNRD